MNKDNFQKLIDAIEKDGKFRFNMSSFIGQLTIDNDDYTKLIVNGTREASWYNTNMLSSVQTTEIFNCNSVGCVAGFAVAIANDWQTPEWLKKETGGYQYKVSFEEEANKFLGLSEGQGKKIYYNDEDSIWKYLAFHHFKEFPDLKIVSEDTDIDPDDCDDWLNDAIGISFNSIDYKTAVKALTLIMNEEIILGHDFGDIRVGCKV